MKKTILFSCIFFISLFSSAQNLPVQIEVREGTFHPVYLVCHNYTAIDYFVNLYFPILKGYKANQPLPFQATVKPTDTKILIIKRIRNFKKPTFRYTYEYLKGRMMDTLLLHHVYSLPVKVGDSVEVRKFSDLDEFSNREGKQPLYGLSFLMNEGDTIYACRDGVVASINSAEMRNERGRYNFQKGNNILELFHADGSFSRYSQVDAVLVEPGDKVEEGQPIAVVGGLIYKGKEPVNFVVYYLDKKKISDLTSQSKYSLLQPEFDTQNKGLVVLEGYQTYVRPPKKTKK